MGQPTLADVTLWLESLYEPKTPTTPSKLDLLKQTHAGAIFEPPLASTWERVRVLPASLTGGGAPFAQELGAADSSHDAWATAIGLLREAILVAPSTPADVRARVDGLAAVLPSTGARSAPYADEAAAAGTWRAALQTHGAELSAVPLAWEGAGRTLSDWFSGLAAAADTIGGLLEARSDALRPATTEDRSAAMSLRSQALGLVRDCRSALRTEVEGNAALPQDLDGRLFGFLDDLAAKRGKSGATGGGDDTEKTEVAPG